MANTTIRFCMNKFYLKELYGTQKDLHDFLVYRGPYIRRIDITEVPLRLKVLFSDIHSATLANKAIRVHLRKKCSLKQVFYFCRFNVKLNFDDFKVIYRSNIPHYNITIQ